MGNEGFDQIAAGLFEGFGTAEMGGVGLHEIRIEVVLADQKAELVAETRLAIVMTVAAGIERLRLIRLADFSGLR